jgi:hypothetical protein
MGTELPAASFSDGTLRFLALALMEADPEETGVMCLEEPENGVHPSRIEAMLSLLQDIALDPEEASGDDNPLRQVIVNTHSPTVVAQVPAEALLFAQSVARPPERREQVQSGRTRNPVTGLELRCLDGTWRSSGPSATPSVALGDVLAYLNPTRPSQVGAGATTRPKKVTGRVQDYAREKQLELGLTLDAST